KSVPGVGFEPTSLAATDFKSAAYASSATPACFHYPPRFWTAPFSAGSGVRVPGAFGRVRRPLLLQQVQVALDGGEHLPGAADGAAGVERLANGPQGQRTRS